jgi:LysR family transcriptional regulator, low CO2-responsive transcriptional regulator
MLNVSIRQLRVFSTVARHLSFARAAEELHLTPPAVSMQVRDLEEAVGLPLFDRRGKRIALTTGGEYFLLHARRVLGSLKDAEDTIARLKGVRAGRVTIGMVGTAKYFVPRILGGFLRDHPGVEVALAETNREGLIDLLRRNEVDFAVMGTPPRELETRSEPFAAHPLGIIAAPATPTPRSPRCRRRCSRASASWCGSPGRGRAPRWSATSRRSASTRWSRWRCAATSRSSRR